MVKPSPAEPSAKNRGGRPNKLTMRIALRIVGALWQGYKLGDAARLGGVSPATLYAWLERGQAGDEAYRPLWEAVEEVKIERGRIGGHKRLSLAMRSFWKPFR